MRLIACLVTLILLTDFSLGLDSLKTNKLDSVKITYKPKKTTIFQDLGSDLGIMAIDWGAYLISPFIMDARETFLVSAFLAGTAISSATDLSIRKKYYRFGFDTYNRDVWDVPTFYGYVQYPSILGGVMYAAGLFAREKWLRTTGRQLIQALIYGGTLTIGLRYLTGRVRPYLSPNDQYQFHAFEKDGEKQSFPSGHMVVAMTTSTVLAENIDTWWARAVLYPFALWTGIARMYNDRHWFSDIIAGAALGFGSGIFVINRERNREREQMEENRGRKRKTGGGFSIIPTGNGFHFTYGF